MSMAEIATTMDGVQHLEAILGMKGGDGELSYAKNCSSQTKLLHSVRPILEQTVQSMPKLTRWQNFNMADLGCSSSQNSKIAMETVLEAAILKYKISSVYIPKFHVYFNDLPSNDFQSLFARLSSNFIYRDTTKNYSNLINDSSRVVQDPCYYSEVVGSFYTPLFPSESLHFVHCSCSLHWLSKIPDTLLKVTSPSYNRWEAFIAREGSLAVARAYLEQFQCDFSAFLRVRASEVVQGGVMFLVLPCRVSPDPRHQGSLLSLCGQLLGSAFRDLIMEGLLEEDKLHSFNLPFFSPTMEELQRIVRSEGSFELQKCQVLRGEVAGMVDNKDKMMEDHLLLGKNLSRQYRNGLEAMIESHIGSKLTHKLFLQVEIRAAQMGQECIHLMEDLTQLIAVLVKQ